MKVIKIFSKKQCNKDFGKLSIGKIQRKYNIGFNYAQNIMDALFENGFVGEEDGYNPRKLLREEQEVFRFIDKNLKSYRPPEYDEFHGSNYYGGLNDMSSSENPKNFDYMEGYDFEEYCVTLLKNIGYTNVEVTKGSNDNGIDILATLGGVKYGIQCKRYSSDVGVKAVQEAYAGAKYYNCHVPVVLTNQFFTKQAKEMAGRINVLLWDRDYLEALVSSCKSNKFF